MSTPFKTLLPKVLPSCPGCGIPMAVEAVRQTVIDFCQRAKAWQAEHTITFVADTPDYALTLPANTVLVDVVKCLYNADGLPIVPKSEAQLDAQYAGWRQWKASRPSFYYLPDLSTIRLVAMPSQAEANAVTAKLAVKPIQAATEFDTELYDQYADALAAGAMARLMLMPQQQWTNPKLAAIHGGMYEAQVGKTQKRVFKNNTRTSLYASAPEFGFSGE